MSRFDVEATAVPSSAVPPGSGSSTRQTLIDVATVLGIMLGILTMLAFVVAGVALTFGPTFILPAVFALALPFGWVFYTFLRYRQVRQDELMHVVATAIEANLPLAPAIRSFLHDRAHESAGSVWDILLLFVFFPACVLWYQRHSFDRRTAVLANLLDEGVSLSDALHSVRGLAPPEVKVAAAVGELTGRLAACLRQADRQRLSSAWLEVVPRLMYPFLLLLFICGITAYLMSEIMPRIQRIYADFGMPLPVATQRLFAVSNALHEAFPKDLVDEFDELIDKVGAGPVAAVLFLAVAIPVIFPLAVLIAVPSVRWYVPLLGRLFRWEAQGIVLRLLGSLIEAGRTAPESLRILEDGVAFSAVVRRCLDRARRAVERGEPLATALRRAGLLPASMAPLVQTSERMQSLPWALTELGDVLTARAVRLARRVSFVLSPALVVAVGALVGFIVLGLFMPLIDILTRLAE